MNNTSMRALHVGIVGGGLAGLATAVALADRGLRITLFESRRMLGGRATSYRDPETGELIDNCQHVSMRCCTNLTDFCRRTGLNSSFREQRTLHFFSPSGKAYDFASSNWLPAPLHLAPALLRLRYLTLRERFSIARAMHQLMRTKQSPALDSMTIGAWLRAHGQTDQLIDLFWSVVLVSALSETVDRASFSAARKVFVDGFMASRDAYVVEVPTIPLGELYGDRLRDWLEQRGVSIHLGTGVKQIHGDSSGACSIETSDGRQHTIDYVVLAAPWRRVPALLSPALSAAIPSLQQLNEIESAPITGVHLWFDHAITDLSHAVFVGRLSQWLFNRNDARQAATAEHYYQVVISASRDLELRNRQSVIDEILQDLRSAFADTRNATLLRWKMITEQHAVFSVTPRLDALRPEQQSAVHNLILAGDWTQTGWPATMEGAVRSGYLAAEAVLKNIGRPVNILAPDPNRGWLPRLLLNS